MLREWEKKFPGRIDSIFGALGNVVPSHLLDRALFDFAAVRTTGSADGGRRHRVRCRPRARSAPPMSPRRPAGRHRYHRPEARVQRLTAATPTPAMRSFRDRRAAPRDDSQSARLWRRCSPCRSRPARPSTTARREADTRRPGAAERIARGRLRLYFRHTATDFGQNDEKMTASRIARTSATSPTAAAPTRARSAPRSARSAYPIGDVLASPFCRTRETAQLIFGRLTVAPAVRGGPAPAEAGRYADLKLLLARRVPPNVNVAIASHGNPFVAVAGATLSRGRRSRGDRAAGDAGFRIVARIRKDEWSGLK